MNVFFIDIDSLGGKKLGGLSHNLLKCKAKQVLGSIVPSANTVSIDTPFNHGHRSLLAEELTSLFGMPQLFSHFLTLINIRSFDQ